MSTIQTNTGGGNITVNATTVWDRIVKLEENVGVVGTPIKEQIDGLSSQLVDIATKTAWIDPDKYSGSDAQKLQSALNDADTLDKEIVLTRQYDITGSTLYVKKTDWGNPRPIRLTGLSGGITKNDAGFIFSSNRSDNLYVDRFKVQNVKFKSVSGAGTKVFNFDKLFEVVSISNHYMYLDCIAYSEDINAQTPRFSNDNIYGGIGYAFDFLNLYDFVIDNCIIDQREAFFRVRSSVPTSGDPNPNGYGANALRITNNVIQGLTGTSSVIKLGFSSVAIISGNYFEENKGVDIDLSQNPGYGVMVMSNFIHDSKTTKTCILLPSVAVKADSNSDQYTFISNHVRGGATMFDFVATPDPAIKIISIGNFCNNGVFIKSHPELFNMFTAPQNGSLQTSTGTVTYVTKAGITKYRTTYDDGGVGAGATFNATVQLGFTISSDALVQIRIIQSTDGVTPYPPTSNLFVSNVSISGQNILFTVNNKDTNWRRTTYDIQVIDM